MSTVIESGNLMAFPPVHSPCEAQHAGSSYYCAPLLTRRIRAQGVSPIILTSGLIKTCNIAADVASDCDDVLVCRWVTIVRSIAYFWAIQNVLTIGCMGLYSHHAGAHSDCIWK